jgi:hypothetical protein
VTFAGVELDGVFGDIVFVAITVAFFALAWLLVRLCERISGTAEIASVTDVDGVDTVTGTRAAA